MGTALHQFPDPNVLATKTKRSTITSSVFPVDYTVTSTETSDDLDIAQSLKLAFDLTHNVLQVKTVRSVS